MDILVLFGKHLYTDGGIDWIAESRCELAIKLLSAYPTCDLIITGGRTNLSMMSEASKMKSYIVQRIGNNRNIFLEEEGVTTINQLYILKKDYLAPSNQRHIGLISDQIHIKRLELIANHLLGEEYKPEFFGAEVRLSGHYRKAIEERERQLRELISNNPVLRNFPSGSHEAWALFDEFYRQEKAKENVDRLGLLDVNDKFLNFYKNHRKQDE